MSSSPPTVSITSQEFNQLQNQILQFKQLYYDEKQKLDKEKESNTKLNEKIAKYQKHFKSLKDQNAKFKQLVQQYEAKSAQQAPPESEKKESKRKFFGFGAAKATEPSSSDNELHQLREEYNHFREAKKRELNFFLAEKNQIQDQLQLLRDHFDGVRIEMAHHLNLDDIKELKAQIKRVLQIQDSVAEGEADSSQPEEETNDDDRGDASVPGQEILEEQQEPAQTAQEEEQSSTPPAEDQQPPPITSSPEETTPQDDSTTTQQQESPKNDTTTPPPLSVIQNAKSSLTMSSVTVGSPKIQPIPTTEHLTALHAQISSYKHQAELFMEKNKLKQNRIMELEEQQKEFQKQIDEYKDALAQYRTQVKQKGADLDHLFEDHQRLIDESKSKDSELNTAQQMISSYTKRLKEAQESKEKVAQEAHSLRSEVQSLKQSLAESEDNSKKLSSTIQELKNKVLHQEEEIRDLTTDLSTRDKQLQEEKRQKEMLLFRVKEFKQMMNKREKSLQTEIDIMKEDSKMYDQQAKEYIHVWVQMVADSVTTQHARQELDSHLDEMVYLREQNAVFSEENQQLKTQNRALETRVSDTKVYYHLQVKQQNQLIKELKSQLKKERKRQQQQQNNWETSSTTSVETTETTRNVINSPSFSGMDSSLMMSPSSATGGGLDYQQLLSARDILTRENNVLLQRVGHLQATNWQHEETIKALERTLTHSKEELTKKSLIIQDYIKREKLGALSPKLEQQQKLVASKKAAQASWSLWSRTNTPTTPDPLEVQTQTQAVLEETLLKNLELADEVEVLTKENHQLKDIIKTQLMSIANGSTTTTTTTTSES